MNHLIAKYSIPVVNVRFDEVMSVETLNAAVVGLINEEGVVIRFDNGHMAKIKGSQYIAIHKAKENLLYERYVLLAILEEKLDDILPFLLDDDRARLLAYSDSVIRELTRVIKFIHYNSVNHLGGSKVNRKVFALEYAKEYGPFASIIFRNFEAFQIHSGLSWQVLIQNSIVDMVKKSCGSNSKLREFKKAADLQFNWLEIGDE